MKDRELGKARKRESERAGEDSSASPRTRRRQRARQAFLDAARGLVVVHGPSGLSLREVARQTDYSPAALYEYFDSRDALLEALMREGFDELREVIAAVPDPQVKEHQNILFRHMLETVHLPSWVRQVIVAGDAGFAANKTFEQIEQKGWTYVFAISRSRKFTNGKYVSDLVRHLPKSCYGRRAIHKLDGRRCDYWVFQKRVTLHNLGDVTMILSKKRRNTGPKQVRLFVTNLDGVKARTILSLYAWRWGVEVTIKELKGGLHLGQMQVTPDADRVARSVALSVCAYLVLVRLYGRDEAPDQSWSLFRLKQRFSADIMRDQIDRTERKWQRKIKQYEDAA